MIKMQKQKKEGEEKMDRKKNKKKRNKGGKQDLDITKCIGKEFNSRPPFFKNYKKNVHVSFSRKKNENPEQKNTSTDRENK